MINEEYKNGLRDGYKDGVKECEPYMRCWISVKDKLPEHDQIILVYAKTKGGKNGFGVATFIDSVKMNLDLWKKGYGNEAVDVIKNPYYFVSQEIRQHTFNNVSHWMPLPEPPM